ncbi:MAG TPA: DUF3054 domain-containing protein [Candidatus Lustribacter sp.]|nr:DUF3054 domain-containing protein [Candidatus Lustribacter sp.]
MPLAAALAADLVAVTAFAAIGRASHAETGAAAAILLTAWPFLAGLALGWAGVRVVSGHGPLTVRDAIPVWLSTVAVGMLLRALTGRGTAVSFIVVASIATGALLLGWRALAASRGARR